MSEGCMGLYYYGEKERWGGGGIWRGFLLAWMSIG